MEFFNNLLQTSWLSSVNVDVFGLFKLNGWLLLLIGFAVVMIALGLFAWRLTALRALFLCLLAVPIFIALIIIWPDLWFWPTVVFTLLFVLALFLLIGFKLVKWAAFLTIIAVLAALFGFGIQLRGGLDPNAPVANCVQAEEAAAEANVSIPHYFNLEPNKPLNTFGTDPVVRDQASLLVSLHDRRCVDPALTSSHFATWGIISFDLIDEYTARFNASRELWMKAIGQMEQFEQESMDYAKEQNIAFALSSVPTGKSTLYMESDGNGGVQVRLGHTISPGSGLVFEHPDGRTVDLRVECGFQPTFDTPPGGPECEDGNNCIPDDCPPWYPHGEPETGCKDDPSADPGPNGNAPDGSGPNADPGPGEETGLLEQPADTSRENPATPTPTATTPPTVVVIEDPVEQPVVVPEEQPVNNGVVPVNPTPAQPCNSEFQSCP